MSKATTSVCGKYQLVGDTYYKHCTAEFGFVGEGDSIMYRDCDGRFAELYQDDGKTMVTLLDLDADDLDLVPDLSFDRISMAARAHLESIGYDADLLPEASNL
jgi:hypothetical protein